jgi:hypothetical protein
MPAWFLGQNQTSVPYAPPGQAAPSAALQRPATEWFSAAAGSFRKPAAGSSLCRILGWGISTSRTRQGRPRTWARTGSRKMPHSREVASNRPPSSSCEPYCRSLARAEPLAIQGLAFGRATSH